MTIESLTKLFDFYAADTLLRAGGLYGGCEYRAHLIAADLHEKGLKPQKAWIWAPRTEEDGEGKIYFKPSRYKSDRKYWYFNLHVAPVVKVEQEDVVLDIVLYNGPVRLSTWRHDFMLRGFFSSYPPKFHMTEGDILEFIEMLAHAEGRPCLRESFSRSASVAEKRLAQWAHRGVSMDREPWGQSDLRRDCVLSTKPRS